MRNNRKLTYKPWVRGTLQSTLKRYVHEISSNTHSMDRLHAACYVLTST